MGQEYYKKMGGWHISVSIEVFLKFLDKTDNKLVRYEFGLSLLGLGVDGVKLKV